MTSSQQTSQRTTQSTQDEQANHIEGIQPHKRRRSYFVTTERNLLLYWLGNLIIYPVYFTCVLLFVFLLLPDLNHPIQFALRATVSLVLIIPIVSTLYMQKWWQSGLVERELTVLTSAAIIPFIATIGGSADWRRILLSGDDPPAIIKELLLPIAGIWLLFTIFQVTNHRRWRNIVLIVLPTILLLMFVGLLVFLPDLFAASLNQISARASRLFLLLSLAIVTIVVLYSVWRIVRLGIEHINYTPKITRRRYYSIWGASILGLFLILYLVSLWSDRIYPLTLGGIGILLLIIASKPDLFFSRLVAGFRQATHRSRHDLLTDRSAPTIGSQHWINKFTKWIKRVVTWNNRAFFFSLCLIVGGIIIPAFYLITIVQAAPTTPEITFPSLFELMVVGVTGSLTLSAIYFTFWLIRNRSRYIVSQFRVLTIPQMERNSGDGIKADPELNAIANLATHILVEELQKIAVLLRLRQIENVNLDQDNASAFFVTSGSSDQDFINQMQELVNIEIPNQGTVSLGRLLALGLRLLARVRVEGAVQRRSNQNVEIWVQLVYGNNNAAAVEQVIVPENSIVEIDEVLVRPIVRQIAIKLLMELGQLTHLGSTVDSISDALIGLEASANRDWWRAISYFRKWLAAEETRQRSFGIGHYHLGVALLNQGDLFEGMEHLKTAENEGPPIAETQYMLSLALLYVFWDYIDKNPSAFREIDFRLKNAIRMRSDFAEAYQLRGVLYYQRGRLHERNSTAGYKLIRPADKAYGEVYKYYFQQAANYFRLSLELYDRRNKKSSSPTYFSATQNQTHAIIVQRMTTAHQLGDALRMLGRYAEADTFYYDMLMIFPRNIRNLTDMTKTYCLAQNWQRAEEFLWQFVFNDDIAYWDADVCMHMGWALAGGLIDSQTSPVKRLVDKYVREYYKYNHDDEFLYDEITRYQNNTEKYQNIPTLHILTQAFQFLDYAIHQRPRYITYHAQTNWWNPINRAIQSINTLISTTPNAVVKPETYANEKLNGYDSIQLKQLKVWLALRIHSFGIYARLTDEAVPIGAYKKDAEEFLSYIKQNEGQFDKFYESLLGYREEVIDFNQAIHDNRIPKRSIGLVLNYQRLEIGIRMWKEWQEIKRNSCLPLTEAGMCVVRTPNFLDRWRIEIASEFAMLTIKMLAEGQGYEYAYQVADDACKMIKTWNDWWKRGYRQNRSDKNYFTFSPRITRYHHASFLAWRAYTLLQCRYDRVTFARCLANDAGEVSQTGTPTNIDAYKKLISMLKQDSRYILEQAQEDISKAKEIIPNHPLTNFVQGMIQSKRGLHARAIETYEKLIDLISPYDPKRPANPPTGDYAPPTPSRSLRRRMNLTEKATGRQQFYGIINVPVIHQAIADVYDALKQPELRVQHLLEAVRQSVYDDLDLDNFLRIANQLNHMDRYSDAVSVIEALQYPAHRLGHTQLFETKRALPQILKCTIFTRSNRYSEGLILAKEIARSYQLPHNTDEPTFTKDYLASLNLRLTVPQCEQLAQIFKQAHEKIMGANWEVHFELDRDISKRFDELNKALGIKTEEETKGLSVSLQTFVKKHAYSGVNFSNQNTTTASQEPKSFLIFKEIENPSNLNWLYQLSARAIYALDNRIFIEMLRRTLNDAREPDRQAADLENPLKNIVLSQLLYFYSREASNALSQIAELCNMLAYNRAETGLDFSHAFTDSACAIAIMSYLLRFTPHDESRRKHFSNKLAQFYDTFGWVRYRKYMSVVSVANVPDEIERLRLTANSIDSNREAGQTTQNRESQPAENTENQNKQHYLEIAEEFLHQGSRYDPHKAIIYYHLARLHLTYAELVWQRDASIGDNARMSIYGTHIDSHLLKAFRAWREANKLDRFGRLHERLAWLYNRVNTLKRHWERRQLRIVAGDPTAYETFGDPD